MRKVIRKILNCALVVLLLLALAAPVLGRSVAAPSTDLNSIEEYDEFFSKYYIKDDGFVHYRELRSFGEFVKFHTNVEPGRYWSELEYYYILKDANGFPFRIRVVCCEQAQKIEGGPMHEGLSFKEGHLGKKTLPTPGAYKRDDICYEYDAKTGVLQRIVWNFGTYQVSINAALTYSFADYPMDGETTFVSRLLSLNADEAAAARQELDAAFPRPKPDSPWPYVIVAVCVAGFVALLVVRHIRRKKRLQEIIRAQITA